MEAWENLTLGLLPERKWDWRTFAASYGLEVVLILLIILAGILWAPNYLQLQKRYTVTEILPTPDLSAPKPVELKQPQHPIVAKLLPPAPVALPKLVVPKELRVVPKKMEEAPKVVMNTFQPVNLESSMRQPKLLHTGGFEDSTTATVKAPIQKVQTGGFGDPNGVAQSKQNSTQTIAKLGGFDLPEGQGTGNGTGGINGTKGTIASAGFGSGIAQTAQEGRGGQVQTGGFGAQQFAQATRVQSRPDNAQSSSVEITFKPNPVYTDEARQLKVQGEVLLEVMFGANGELHINRVVRGLGHGLDEAAVEATNRIKFKPAMRSGVAVDSTAVVHVTFQMAF